MIRSEGDTLSANLREACELPEYWHFPTDCDGGSPSATYRGNPVLLSMDYGKATYNITLSLDGDTLRVTTVIHYTDSSGRADSTSETEYRKQAVSFPESEQIVFYRFFAGPRQGAIPPVGIRTPVLLVAGSSDEAYRSDTAADLRTALELALQDESNAWASGAVDVVDLTFRDGHADIALQGEYSAESDELLRAAGMQILLTVFANPAVQTATVTLNGDTAGNLGISGGTDARPAGYVYTRAEMDTYLKEHAYSMEYEAFFNR